MKKVLLPTLLLAISLLNIAEAQRSWNEIEFPPLNSFDKPDIEIFELDNGIRFYLVEDHELPLINLRVMVRTGGVLVPNDKAGLNSITGTVMRTGGTTSISGDDLSELLEDRAARMETSIGLSSGSATMNVLKEDFEELLPVFVDLLSNPAFPDSRIDLAKTQQKTSISRRNDESIPVGLREFQKLIYGPESVYARTTEYATIDNITRDDLVDFHAKSFVGQNMMIGLVGDFDSAEIRAHLEREFSAIPAGEKLDLNFPEVDYEFVSSINFVDKRDVNQSFVMLGHIGGLRENPDYAKLQVMNRILSDGFSGRLMRIVRSQMGLAYSVFGEYGSGNFYPGMFYSGVMTQSETTAEAINAILDQIKRLQDEPVSEQELQDTKDRFLNSLVFQYTSIASVLNERLSLDYAGLDPDTFDRLVEEIQAVAIEDIQQVAQQYLQPGALQILVVGNGAEIGDQLEQFGEINEVDITIPEPGDDEEAVAGDAASGKEWATKMAAAVLPNGTIDGELVVEADQFIEVAPGNEMAIGLKQTTDFSTGTITAEVAAPMGQITMKLEGNEGVMMMAGNEMPMPAEQRDQLLEEYYRNPVYIALNYNDMDIEYIGNEEIDGVEYVHIRLNNDSTINLFLDPETALPVITTYRQFDPMQGARVTVRVVSEDWTEADGVVLPYKATAFSGDTQAGRTVINSHSVN
ncbi:MAG: insulinase family protein [Balneolaceae bacterium]|nr:MAG: insulinase family protein [Balneolaceae bacterium]